RVSLALLALLGLACRSNGQGGGTTMPPRERAPSSLVESPPTTDNDGSESAFRVFGSMHALCVLVPGEAVYCAGSNFERQLASEGERHDAFMASDRFLASDVDIHLGNSHACALDAQG